MEKILKKILIVELIIIFILVLLINFEPFSNMDFIDIKDIKNVFQDTEDEKHLISNLNIDENDKYLYKTIRNGLLEGEESIRISEKILAGSPDNLFDIVNEVLMANPEILYYSGGKYSSNTFYPEYDKTVVEKQEDQKAIRVKREEILSQIIDSNMSQYEVVKAIHDYIVNNTKYDIRYYDHGQVPTESYNVYGVLFEGIAVCEGYAKTMKFFLDEIGMENLIVTGVANGENHAWNMVKIDGDYYHIDATWDDPITEDESDILIYDYFNLKDEDMEKTHTWNRDQYPKCNSDVYNYYNYNDLVVYNYDEFYNKIFWALVNGQEEIALKLVDFNEKIYDIPTIINKITRNNPNLILLNKYSYSINTAQGIVRIYFIK